MISRTKLDRINYLANKKKKEGLNSQELEEQRVLREEYLKNFRKSMKKQLDNIKFVDEEDVNGK